MFNVRFSMCTVHLADSGRASQMTNENWTMNDEQCLEIRTGLIFICELELADLAVTAAGVAGVGVGKLAAAVARVARDPAILGAGAATDPDGRLVGEQFQEVCAPAAAI